MDVVLVLSVRNIETKLDKKNEETGIYPFTSLTISSQCELDDVYVVNMYDSHNEILDINTNNCMYHYIFGLISRSNNRLNYLKRMRCRSQLFILSLFFQF